MKNNLVRISILVLGAAAGYAQNVNSLKANIPFNFTARGVNLPAGEYSVDTRNPSVVILQSPDGHSSLMVGAGAAESLYPQREGRLVFHRYGNQYFLSEVWMSGSSYGRRIPPSKQERTLAQRQTESSEVILAALR